MPHELVADVFSENTLWTVTAPNLLYPLYHMFRPSGGLLAVHPIAAPRASLGAIVSAKALAEALAHGCVVADHRRVASADDDQGPHVVYGVGL
jgi:hypothetical protein